MSSLYDTIDFIALNDSLKKYQAELEKVGRFVEYDRTVQAFAPRIITRKARKAHCYGLPRTYPKFWMARPHSNSLGFEFRTMQNKPVQEPEDWKE